MPRNTKAKGRNNERRAAKWLAKFGFTRCMISAASKGVFDIICWNKYNGVFVQVKTNKLPPREEMKRLLVAAVPPKCLKMIFVWFDHQRSPEVWNILSDSIVRLEKEEYSALFLSD